MRASESEAEEQAGDNMVIMGSGAIISQFTEAGLIDEFQIVLCPIALDAGRTLFGGAATRPSLGRTHSRTFKKSFDGSTPRCPGSAHFHAANTPVINVS